MPRETSAKKKKKMNSIFSIEASKKAQHVHELMGVFLSLLFSINPPITISPLLFVKNIPRMF
jgi:hypothetical protein